MGKDSAIGWTHHTFNVVWGCQKVSAACDHCYAETFAKRVGLKVWGPPKTTERRVLSVSYWNQPLKWDRAAKAAGERHRVFCSSMADVFEDHPTVAEQRARLWPIIESTPNLDWLLLTKRPENIMSAVPVAWRDGFPPNVWAGTTTENQELLERRWSFLRVVPARVRFISVEPMMPGPMRPPVEHARLLHWVIIGGESGADDKRRELDVDAAVDFAERLHDQGIPVFVKQDSGRVPGQRGRLPDWLWSLKQFPRTAP